MTNALNVDVGRVRDQLGSSYQVGTDANQSGNVNLIIIPPFKNDVGVELLPTRWETRLIGTAFIFGHSSNGVLGTSAFGVGTMGNYVLERVVSKRNKFVDYFKDDLFNDSTNSTATWDTTNSRWEFISGDVGQTGTIFMDKMAVSAVKINLTQEGLSSFTKIDKSSFPGGREVNLS